MALQYIGKTDEVGASAAVTSFTTAEPAGTAVGDLMLWKTTYNNASVQPPPSGWLAWTGTSTTALGQATWYRFKQSGDPSSWTYTGTSFRWGHGMVSWRGVDTTTPQDVTPVSAVGTTLNTFPAITPVTAGAHIVADASMLGPSTTTNVTWATTNLDVLTNDFGSNVTTTTNVFVGSGYEAWTSGAFTPNLTHAVASTRTISIAYALRPATSAAYSGTATLSGSGSLSASGTVGGVTDYSGSATLSGVGSLSAVPVGYQAFTYEEGTPGNVMTTSSPGVNAVIGGAPSAAPYYVATPFTGHGSVAARCDTITVVNNSWFRYNDYFGDLHTGQLYVQFDTIVSSNNPIVGFREPGIGAANVALIGQIRQGTGASAGKIILFSGASVTAATSTVAFASGDKCRLDWQFYKHGDLYDMSVRIFKNANVEGTTPDDTISATNMSTVAPGTAFGTITLGIASANPGVYTYDTLRTWQGVNFWPPPYGVTTVDYTGTATLGGDGSLAAGGAPAVPVPAALSGTGSLTTTQAPRPVVTAALSGDGTLATTQLPRFVIGAASFASLILAAAPDAWYRHGEPSGTTMNDSSGNARHGTYTGAVTLGVAGLVTGDSDTAMSTTGATTMYGTATYGSWMNRVTDIGVGVIFDTNVTTLQYLVQRWNTTAPDQLFGIDIGNTSGQVRGYLGMNGGAGNVILTTSGLSVLDGNKHMAFICWRASDPVLRIYVDGVQAATVSCAGTLRSTTDPFTIGRRTGVNSNFMNGITDETYFGPALTPQQIADLWTAVTTGPTGGVQLGGSGSLTTTAAPAVPGGAALSGDGTLGAVGGATTAAYGTATLSGDGALTTSQKPSLAPSVALSGAGTLSTVQVPTAAVTAALSGSGALTTTQRPGLLVPIALSGAGTLTTVPGLVVTTGTAALTGSGTLNALRLYSLTAVEWASSATGSTWVNPTNAVGADNGTYATWTSSTASAVSPPLEVGFGTFPDIPGDARNISVRVRVKGYWS